MCAVLALFAVAVPSARALDQTCHTSSDYDLTVTDAALQFDRKNAPGRRLEMRKGALAVNNQAVALGGAIASALSHSKTACANSSRK